MMRYLLRNISGPTLLMGLALSFTVAPSLAEAESSMQGKVSKDEKAEKSEKSEKSEKESSKGLNTENISKILEKHVAEGGLLKSTCAVVGEAVSINTWINPKSKSQENDAKIDSVLLSKKLLDAYPNISGFRYSYFDSADPSRYMEITVESSHHLRKAVCLKKICLQRFLQYGRRVRLKRRFQSIPTALALFLPDPIMIRDLLP